MTTYFTSKRLILAASLVVALSGCQATREANTINQAYGPEVQDHYEQGSAPTRSTRSFEVDEGFHAARAPLATPAPNVRPRLPGNFQSDASLERLTPTSLNDIATHISRMSGYRVILAPEVFSGTSAPVLNDVLYRGDLSGLLDHVAGVLNLSWRWTGSHIEIFRYETRMFRISALAGTIDVTTTLDTTSSSSGGGENSTSSGDSGQTTNISSNFDIWEDITSSIRGVLTQGGNLSVSPSAGTITVRDTPAALDIVEAQVREFNAIYSRQVQMHVQVYSVERSAADTVGVDWTVAWQNAARTYGLNFNTTGTGTSNDSPSPTFSGLVTNPNSSFDGSGAVVQALSSIGNTTLLTSGIVSSLNGQSVPLNVSREQAYLESYSTTLTSGDAGNSTTTLTPGVITDGFSMHFTPRILEDNQVMMRFSVDLSSTDAIDTFESPDGNSAIQLPRRSSRNFLQNVSMRSGQTMVMSGFQQTVVSADGSGPGSPRAWLLGGSRSSQTLVRTIVIVVTPVVVE